MPDARKYSDDEVREIIERALKTEDAPASAITHGDLLAIGEQIGVTPEVMKRAAREISQARLELAAAQGVKSRRRKFLALHAVVFVVINALLFTVNFLTTPGEWWFLFSVFFWGLALAAHAGIALGTSISARTLARERRKLEAELPERAKQKLRIDEPSPEPELQDHAETADAPTRKASRP
jgi:hypothetical protein